MTIVVLVIVSSGLGAAAARRARQPRHAVRARGALDGAWTSSRPRTPRRGAAPQGGAARRALRPGRHRRHGRAQLRPLAAAGADQPERGRRAARVRPRERRRSSSARGSPTPRRCAARRRAELPALAEASRTVGSPQIRNRGTIGGNLGTASPAGDALPPLLVEDAEVEIASVRGERARCRSPSSCSGVKQNALAPDELVVCGAGRRRARAPQTFMKVGPRNAMVISVCSLALHVDRERGELRAAFGSAAPTVRLVTAPLDEADGFPDARRRQREPDRRRARHRRLPPPRARASSRAARSRGASHEDRADRQRRARARPTSGAARACSSRCASSSGCPARRTRASRASAARARCCSTATLVCSCLVLAAQADGHEVVTVEGVARGRRAAPRAGGVRRRRRRAVRLLHAGPDRRHRRPARAHARARRTTRSARRSRAISAAAPATRRSSTRCGRRPRA